MSMQQQTPQVAEPSPQKLALSVAFAGLISGLVIISIFEATLPTITANKAAELKAAVFKVLPGVASMKKLQYSDGGLSERTQEGA